MLSTQIPSKITRDVFAFILQNIRERMSLNQYLYDCESYVLGTEKLFGLHLDFAKIEFSSWIFFHTEDVMNCWNLYCATIKHILYQFCSLTKLLLITNDLGNLLDSLIYVPLIVRKRFLLWSLHLKNKHLSKWCLLIRMLGVFFCGFFFFVSSSVFLHNAWWRISKGSSHCWNINWAIWAFLAGP